MLEMFSAPFRSAKNALLGHPPRISAVPEGVKTHPIAPRPSNPVFARPALSSGYVESGRGPLAYENGEHYLVEYAPGDVAPVQCEIFERTYRKRSDGLYQKREDLTLCYFTLPYDVVVETPEGDQLAEAGDWIVEGAAGELYPMPAEKGARKYRLR